MECIVCKGKESEILSNKLRDSDEHKVKRCINCGLIQLTPIPSIEEDKEFYDENMQAKNLGAVVIDIEVARKNSEFDTLRRAEFVSKQVSEDSDILDFGSGYGFFIEEMSKRGFNITGLEISREKREISAKVSNVKVLDTNLNDSSLQNQKFDCITMFQVLEHISNPVEFLGILKNHLAENGKIIIEVPNADDLMLESNKAYRNFYWQRAHVLYFNRQTLTDVVKKAGFNNYQVSFEQRYGIDNFMNWQINNKPQLENPCYETSTNYKWLEDHYKHYLINSGKSDTLIIVVSNT